MQLDVEVKFLQMEQFLDGMDEFALLVDTMLVQVYARGAIWITQEV